MNQRFGFQKPEGDASYDSMKSRVMDQIERVFRPEFLNRLDDVIIFRHLNKEDLKKVIDFEMAKVTERLKERGFNLILTMKRKSSSLSKARTLITVHDLYEERSSSEWRIHCPKSCSEVASKARTQSLLTCSR